MAGKADSAGPESQPPVEEPGQVAGGPVDVAAVRQLLELMREHDLVEIELEHEGWAVRLRKAGAVVAPAAAQPAAPPPAAGPVAEAAAGAEEDEGLAMINAPMVGTFYASPSPEADAYVQVGDHVTEETPVCTIEAMKVFNEIRAETSGTIEKVLVRNAEPVEFGQPLFAVRPD